MILNRHMVCSIIIFTLYGCVDNASSLDMVGTLPIYKKGYDIDVRNFGSNSNQQLFYKLKVVYPSTEVLNYYKEYYLSKNWRKCKGSNDEWESFVDATRTPESLITK